MNIILAVYVVKLENTEGLLFVQLFFIFYKSLYIIFYHVILRSFHPGRTVCILRGGDL
jgi:hypothetical protein